MIRKYRTYWPGVVLIGNAQALAIVLVGLVRIELTTSSLSVTRSNRLSYSPYRGTNLHHLTKGLFEAS